MPQPHKSACFRRWLHTIRNNADDGLTTLGIMADAKTPLPVPVLVLVLMLVLVPILA